MVKLLTLMARYEAQANCIFENFIGRAAGPTSYRRSSIIKSWPISTPVLQHSQTLRTDRRTFLRSDFYNLLWRPADVDEPLLMIVREGGRTYGVLYIYRAVGELPF